MTPKKITANDPMAEGHPQPFSEPRTIPGGWEVSGFFEPEQKYPYRSEMYGSTHVKSNGYPYEDTENSL